MKQTETVKDLLDTKIEERELNELRKKAQQIKEEEIFVFNETEKISFIKIVFNSSYRKIIDENNYEKYSQYEINLDSIERDMTNSILKKKKLLNENIIEFSYNKKVFNNEVNDLITSFKNKYKENKIDSEDKQVIENFIKENKNNKTIFKFIINDFITLIKYVNDINDLRKKEGKDVGISGKSKISEVVEKLNNKISEEFLLIFKDKNNLTVNKISLIFKYYLKLIYKVVVNEIKDYQEELEENEIELEDKKNKLDEYYCKNEPLISKDNLAHAILLFMILVLFREKDKEKKIKSNRKNIFIYLKAPDLWDMKLYNDEKFNENLNKLKKINIKINQIVWLYNYLVENKQEKKSEDNKDHNEIKKEENIHKNNKSKEDRNNTPENADSGVASESLENEIENENSSKKK